MFNPSGLSVPSLKINFISCCLRPMLLPEHCFKPQIMMSLPIPMDFYFLSQTEIGDSVRKSTNLLLTRTLNGEFFMEDYFVYCLRLKLWHQ